MTGAERPLPERSLPERSLPERSLPERPLPERRRPEPDDVGGDPACWLQRVCPACGRLADEDPPTRCPACGAELPAD